MTRIYELIAEQIDRILVENEATYGNIKATVCNEQSILKATLGKNEIIIVVKLDQGSINLDQKIIPASMEVLSEANKLTLAQRLMNDYVCRYNLTRSKDKKILQAYNTPYVMANFDELMDTYRSTIEVSCSFVISENAYDMDVYYKGKKLEVLANGFSFDANADSGAFYNSSFTKSKARYGTRVLSLSSFLVKDDIYNDMLDVALGTKTINTNFELTIKFGSKETTKNFHLASFNVQQNIGELPACGFTFMED